MARRRSRKRRRPKRRPRKRRRTRMNKTLFGNSQLVKMKYVDSGQITVSLLDIAPVHSYRLNSIFDPNPVPSTTDRSVLGYEQLAPLFNTSQVIGSRATVTFFPGLNQHGVIMYANKNLLNQTGQPALSLPTILSERNVRYRYHSTARQGGERSVVSINYSPKAFHGIKDVRDNEDLKSVNDTLPLLQAYVNFSYAKTHIGGQPITSMDYVIQIEYAVLWSGPVSPPPSL